VDEISLEDRLKLAQIEKTRAESAKIERETQAVGNQVRTGLWSEIVKVLAGVVLGIGGVMVAFTQYEVGELKARIAKDELSRAQAAKEDAEKATAAAQRASDAAVAKRRRQRPERPSCGGHWNRATVRCEA
jgi:hypothetical protein